MFRSLHMKLMLILLLLITSLMAVVGAFLTTSVSSFYINTFYQQMADVFGEDHRDFVSDLRAEAAHEDGAEQLQELMKAYAGELGVDGRNRKLYILDGNGVCLVRPDGETENLEYTPNLSHALSTGEVSSACVINAKAQARHNIKFRK